MRICRTWRNLYQFYWGNEINNDYVWYFVTSDYKSHPVGHKKPNPFGLCDILGNVWEWVEDWFSNDYFKTSPTQNPKGPPSGDFKVKRGGSQANLINHIKSHTRYRAPVDKRHYINGFRIAFSATEEGLPHWAMVSNRFGLLLPLAYWSGAHRCRRWFFQQTEQMSLHASKYETAILPQK